MHGRGQTDETETTKTQLIAFAQYTVNVPALLGQMMPPSRVEVGGFRSFPPYFRDGGFSVPSWVFCMEPARAVGCGLNQPESSFFSPLSRRPKAQQSLGSRDPRTFRGPRPRPQGPKRPAQPPGPYSCVPPPPSCSPRFSCSSWQKPSNQPVQPWHMQPPSFISSTISWLLPFLTRLSILLSRSRRGRTPSARSSTPRTAYARLPAGLCPITSPCRMGSDAAAQQTRRLNPARPHRAHAASRTCQTRICIRFACPFVCLPRQQA
jgi:hypothetical protein